MTASNGTEPVAFDSDAAAATIRSYVLANITALGQEELSDGDNLFERGFVSSIFAMELLDHIESSFGIEVSDENLTLSNFSSVDAMVALVAASREART